MYNLYTFQTQQMIAMLKQQQSLNTTFLGNTLLALNVAKYVKNA